MKRRKKKKKVDAFFLPRERAKITLSVSLSVWGNVTKPLGHCMGTLAATDSDGDVNRSRTSVGSMELPPLPEHHESACWVPHPRTGIYFPKGQERVMEDVPDGAASLVQTHWFRNDPDHGVDHLDH